jgi:hypothetical protein
MNSTKTIKLDQKKKLLQIKDCTIDHPLIFNFFDLKPENERESLLARAIAIGVLGLMEDRLSTFLAKTSNQLGTELETLKIQFDLAQQLFLKSTSKGRDAEVEIKSILENYGMSRSYQDKVISLGDEFGTLSRNKSGDLIIEVKSPDRGRIVIESKFDKGKRLGLISEKDILSKSDTAVGQLLESLVNRDATAAIIVFDKKSADPKLVDEIGSLRFIGGCGFVCIVESQRGDYTSLLVAYDICRSSLFRRRLEDRASSEILGQIVGRFLHDFDLFHTLKKKLRDAADNMFDLIRLVDKAMLSIEFSKEVFSRFNTQGTLSNKELLDFYLATEVREKYQLIEKDIKLQLKAGEK